MRKRRNKVSHIHITDKTTNFARVNKFYHQNNPLLRSGGRRTNILKPLNNKKSLSKKTMIGRGYSKESYKGNSQNLNFISDAFTKNKADSVYANSSASTQIS